MRTLIIGTGISASSWVATAQREYGELRDAVGDRHLWQRLDPDHRMGQPRTLLTGQLLGSPTAQNRDFSRPDLHGFMLTKDFAELVDQRLSEGTETVDCGWVRKISRVGGDRWHQYLVEIDVPIPGGKFTACADRIIIATGPGPLRPLELSAGEPVDVSKMGGHAVPGDDFLAPEWRPPNTMLSTRDVAIFGGSATASWVAELAIARGYHVVLWFVRPGQDSNPWQVQSRFEGAFPAGGRNREVERDLASVRRVLRPTSIRLQRTGSWAFVDLRVVGQSGHEEFYVPDIFVYALGQANTQHAGIRAMLDPHIALIPFYDHNRAISDDQCVVAMGTEDKSLLIVGAALHSLNPDAIVDRARPYSMIARSLPPAARPPEGIALVMASLEAFNEYMPVHGEVRLKEYRSKKGEPQIQGVSFGWDINFNTCNRTQLAVYLAQTTDLPPFAANLAVEMIIKIRARNDHTFGITKDYVNFLCEMADQLWTDLKRLNPTYSDRGSGYDSRFHEVIAQEMIDSLYGVRP